MGYGSVSASVSVSASDSPNLSLRFEPQVRFLEPLRLPPPMRPYGLRMRLAATGDGAGSDAVTVRSRVTEAVPISEDSLDALSASVLRSRPLREI